MVFTLLYKLKKRLNILFVLLTFGFILTPQGSYGCETKSCKSEKTCCAKSKSTSKDKKFCCQNINKNKKNETGGCGGTCGHRSCSCPTTQITFIIPFNTIIKDKFNLFNYKSQPFVHKEIQLSSGFLSIWLPPKIS